jgi:CDGSH-type Zn-finger protein
MHERQKCAYCGKTAFAYRLEPDGSKTWLCTDHLPTDDADDDETPPPVNLIAIRESGPYAARGDIRLDGEAGRYRVTLCRCGASKNKPFCDGSHHDAGFSASGEPPTGKADMLAVRDGALAIDPETDGPLQIRGNLEITSGTGRVVARVTAARLPLRRKAKAFCDGSHARIGSNPRDSHEPTRRKTR